MLATMSVVAAVVSGCATHSIGLLADANRAQHVITVAPDGAPLDPTTYLELDDGEFDRQLDLLEAGIDAGRTDKQPKTQVLLFVHGGLNNRDEGQAHADALIEPMSQDGYYPVFLNWNSDLIDSLREDLLYVRQGRTARFLGPLSSPLAGLSALLTGLVRAPLVWGQMFVSDINASGFYEFPSRRNAAAVSEALRKINDPIALKVGDEETDTAASAAASLRYAVTLPAKLALSPVIDGLGHGAWRNMLRRTQLLFHRESEFDVRDVRDNPEKLEALLRKGPQGGAGRLAGRLTTYLQKHNDVEITLVGHSMGTIVINRLLRNFPELRVRAIVYLAAACTIDDYRASVLPYLARHQETRFYNLSLHPSAEEGEWQKKYLDLPPRGSLLVWIDNFLSDPSSPLDRTLGSWDNVLQVVHVIPQALRARTSLRMFDVGVSRPGPVEPETHGGFSDPRTRFWCPQVWTGNGEPTAPCANTRF